VISAASAVPALRRLFWPALALACVLLANLLFAPGFFRIEIRDGHLYGSLIDVVNRGTPVLLAGLGMTLVIATAGVDLSVGAVAAIAGTVAALLITRTESGLLTIVAVPLGVALLAGLCNGLLVVGAGLQPIVATLVLMVAGRGVAQLLGRGQIITFQHPGFETIGGGYLAGLPCTVSIVAAAYVLAGLLTRRTALGLFIESVGDSPTASYYAGVPAGAVKLFVYAFSGFCAGLSGLIVASDIRAADANNAGLYLELDAILAVVVGGTTLTGGRFSLAGTILGGLIIQTLTTTILTRGVPVEYTLVVKALAVLGVCLLQSAGLRRRLQGSAVPQ
jgi:ribose/xylose/arabinose/galactoside ABC-type transport system permease subunit